ncbi:MAG TPA: hypothetical protein VGC41_25410, partial [Kofleriaceae bacterium]
MRRTWWVIQFAVTASCNGILGIGDPGAAPPDATSSSCVIAGFDLCANTKPNGSIHFQTDVTINTDSDCNIVLFVPTGGSLCVVYATDFEISAHVHGIGRRPLVLAATGTIDVTGTVDVSSTGSQVGAASGDPSCAKVSPTAPYSGPAGGSFHGRGGNGGAGLTTAAVPGLAAQAAVTATPSVLRGGCQSSGNAFDGAGGGGGAPGGGALELAAGASITVGATGVVAANGATSLYSA